MSDREIHFRCTLGEADRLIELLQRFIEALCDAYDNEIAGQAYWEAIYNESNTSDTPDLFDEDEIPF